MVTQHSWCPVAPPLVGFTASKGFCSSPDSFSFCFEGFPSFFLTKIIYLCEIPGPTGRNLMSTHKNLKMIGPRVWGSDDSGGFWDVFRIIIHLSFQLQGFYTWFHVFLQNCFFNLLFRNTNLLSETFQCHLLQYTPNAWVIHLCA